MRFLVDECTGPAVAQWLRERGHEVCSVYDEARGAGDEAIIEKAYRQGRRHKGIVLLRLDDERPHSKIAVVQRLLRDYADRLPGSFVVATEQRIRFAT